VSVPGGQAARRASSSENSFDLPIQHGTVVGQVAEENGALVLTEGLGCRQG
jgi:hypothetical protein